MPTTLGVRSRRSVFLVALLACIAAFASGCGDDGGSTDSNLLALLERAAEKTGSAETVRARFEQRFVGVPGVPEEPTITDLVMTVDGQRGTGTFSQFGEEIDVLLVDEAYYYAFPDLPDGVRWVRVTFADLKEITGLDVGASSDQSPVESLDRLRAAGDITEVGAEELDGIVVTRYRAVVDVDALAEFPEYSEQLIEQIRDLLGDEYELDVWIDDDGYPRRIEWAVDLAEAPDPPPGVPTRGEIRYVQTLSDFGVPLNVTAPPQSEVVDLRDLN